MKRIGRKTILICAVLISSYAVNWNNMTVARGGGFGGGRGGYGRGVDDFDRGFDNRAGEYYGRADEPRSDYFGGFPAASEPRANEAELRAGADREYGINGQHAMPAETGFGNIASVGAGRYHGAFAHSTNAISDSDLAYRGNAVRNAYRDYGVYDRGWWGRYPNAWYYSGWPGGWAWGYSGWPDLAGWWGMSVDSAPVAYDYGNNITYQNDNVYYGSQPEVSAADYYSQAETLAQSIPAQAPPKTSKEAKGWKPLGVFSLTQGEQSNTTSTFQLAVNKAGAIRGNYYDVVTGEVKAITGAVDKKNMRVAWTIAGNKGIIYDTGLANLLKPQSSILVHFGKEQTQQWQLIRLEQSKEHT